VAPKFINEAPGGADGSRGCKAEYKYFNGGV